MSKLDCVSMSCEVLDKAVGGGLAEVLTTRV